MKLQANKIKSEELTHDSMKERMSRVPGVFRVIDQETFDSGNDGGCQFASIFSAIENKYKQKITVEEMRDCYLKADAFWDGKTEKMSRAVKYMMVKGHRFSFGKIKAVKYYSIAPISIDFDLLQEAISKFDYAGIGFMRGSWFSSVTGNLYPQLKLNGFHAVRGILGRDENEIRIINSWYRGNGNPWGDEGIGYIPRDKFDLLKFIELRFCDFIIE